MSLEDVEIKIMEILCLVFFNQIIVIIRTNSPFKFTSRIRSMPTQEPVNKNHICNSFNYYLQNEILQ